MALEKTHFIMLKLFIWRTNDVRWRTNDVRWRTNDVRWRTNDVRWRTNDVRWRTNDVRWRTNDVRWLQALFAIPALPRGAFGLFHVMPYVMAAGKVEGLHSFRILDLTSSQRWPENSYRCDLEHCTLGVAF